jgi:hypothetical protein
MLFLPIALTVAVGEPTTSNGGIDWTAVGTIVALLAAVGSFMLTMRGQKQDRQLAENSAERAEAAARLTDENTGRVIEALERIAASGGTGGTVAVPLRVKWSMERLPDQGYRLENVGDASARQVRVESHPSLRLFPGDGGPDLNAGEAMTFGAFRSLATTDSTITVRWENPDGTTGEWRYPLP